ncbi:Hypothetical predicted protein [Pelobates cultripes]|uniref:Uncharacterized protein n=1 Tax=Pelobates cultripes TaxID=61616 RepID=A0AAD1R7E8_PELCU|nr:Hypothetical predicted protein [Pelobates cultripes]
MHSLILDNHMADKHIPKQREEDDEGISHDKQGFHHGVLGFCSIAFLAHKALPVSQAVVIPGEKPSDVGDLERFLQAAIERQTFRLLGNADQSQQKKTREMGHHHYNVLLSPVQER